MNLKLVFEVEYYQWDFQGPPIMGPPCGKFPIPFPYGSGMGIVCEAYHKGVPLLGVPGITLDIICDEHLIFCKYPCWTTDIVS